MQVESLNGTPARNARADFSVRHSAGRRMCCPGLVCGNRHTGPVIPQVANRCPVTGRIAGPGIVDETVLGARLDGQPIDDDLTAGRRHEAESGGRWASTQRSPRLYPGRCDDRLGERRGPSASAARRRSACRLCCTRLARSTSSGRRLPDRPGSGVRPSRRLRAPRHLIGASRDDGRGAGRCYAVANRCPLARRFRCVPGSSVRRSTTSAGTPFKDLGPDSVYLHERWAFPPHPGGERDVQTQSSECQTLAQWCLPFDDDRASARLVVSPARRPRDTGTPRKRLPPRYTYSSGSAPERHRSRRRWTMPGQDRARPGRRGVPVRPSGEPADCFCAVPLRPRDRRGTGRRGSSASEWPASATSGTIRGLSRPGSEEPWLTGTR